MDGKYVLALRPSGEAASAVQGLRSRLKRSCVMPALPPHITLRENFYSNRIDDFIAEYRTKLSSISPFELRFTGVQTLNRGHIVFLVGHDETLQRLHELSVLASQPYISRPRGITFDIELTREQQEMVRIYENPFYFQYYTPHTTIVRCEDETVRQDALRIISETPLPPPFPITEVVVFDRARKSVYATLPLGNTKNN